MAHNKRGRLNVCGYDGEIYWGSEDYNRSLYDAYMTQVMSLAISRYEWRGLPATVDPIWLERQLLMRGCATIAQPVKGDARGLWVAARMVSDGPLNIYDRPTKWFAYSRDLVRFACDARNGVVVYDNVSRLSTFANLDLSVRELVDIQKTKQMNRFAQKVPYMLVVPNDMELTADNLIAQIMAGVPANIANPTIREIDTYKLDLGVPYIGAELTAAEQNVWNRIYTQLGISNITFKTERMIEDEVRSMSEPAAMMALSGILERRRAADYLNSMFGLDVHVIWRRDNESANINTLENISDMSEVLGGTRGLMEAYDD